MFTSLESFCFTTSLNRYHIFKITVLMNTLVMYYEKISDMTSTLKSVNGLICADD